MDLYKVESLPKLEQNILDSLDLYSGFIKALDNDYFHILSANKKSNKLILWFNGGPVISTNPGSILVNSGCTSMDGFFLENGPLRMNETLAYNPNHWSKYANVAYVDQPAGTGYSVGKFAVSNQEIIDNFMDFLSNFYKAYPDLVNCELFLSGESFAGIWIPYFADAILKHNANSKEKYNLKGLIIGNGWMDPKFQYPAYLVYAQQHGLIKSKDLEIAQNYLDLCKKELKLNPYLLSSQHCEKIMDVIMEASVKDGQYCLNKYDIRLRDHGPNEGCGMSWPPGVYSMGKYLSLHETQKYLHVDSKQYGSMSECNGGVYSHLSNQDTNASIILFPDLLSKIEIVLFVGDRDLICNIIGIRNMVQFLEWGGEKGLKTEPEEWKLDDEMVGTIHKDRNLSLYTIFGGSHMTAFDQPEATLDMIRRILKVDASETHEIPAVETLVPPVFATPPVEILPTVEDPTKVDKVIASVEPEQWPEAEAPPPPLEPPISMLTGVYILFALLGVVVGAIYVMKIIRKRKPPQWDAVPEEEEDLEMEERRRIE
ncbi:Cell death protease [Boothiomyces sp. JEL0866]|nr:Cell death protease [Boothiomyces sp. JEL0866]